MWGYYGSKSKIVNKYPEPEFGKIIEPFAGTAQYSLKYWDRDILLIEKYDVIVKLWKWLQQCSKQDILGLPRLERGENVDNFTWDCEEAKWLVGFIITGAPSQPKKTASKWKTVIRPNTQNYKLQMIADNLHKIKHWDVRQGDFKDLENEEATWFIDPPYQYGGEYYKFGNKDMNFKELGEWCMSRNGQVIVCENSKADWLDFEPLIEMRGNKFKTTECMYLKSDEEKNKAVHDFQKCKKCDIRFENHVNCDHEHVPSNNKIIALSTNAGGVGLTLTAASRMAVIELPWHPADCEQIESRFHRMSQKNSVQCTYFLGKDTIDEHIYDIIEKKRAIADTVLGVSDDRKFVDDFIKYYNDGKIKL